MTTKFAAAFAVLALIIPAYAQAPAVTDDDIRDAIIARSIATYSGNCPCPYNRASNGSRCGGRSAYSRPGGASPKCYRSDVTDAEVARWRRDRGG